MRKILKPFIFFILILIIFVGLFLQENLHKDVDAISSDVWMYQLNVLQQNYEYWDGLPRLYNQEPFYLAYPILYYANLGMQGSMTGYLSIGLVLLVLTYLISGLVIYKFTKSWVLAGLVGVLLIIPKYIYPTQIGLMDFDNVRGVGLVFPLYLLLSLYWVVYGLKDKRKNIVLALVAALSVYLYPPAGILVIGMFILTALVVHRKKYFKPIALFAVIYLLGSSLFWYGHFSNTFTQQINPGELVSVEDQAKQAEIIDFRVSETAIWDVDFEYAKRGLWDGTPLLILFLLSFYLFKKYHAQIPKQMHLAHKSIVSFTIIFILFIFVVDLGNYYQSINFKPPLFVEHLRLARAVGFLWIALAVFDLWILNKIGKKKLAVATGVVLIFYPIYFSAPFIRSVVRKVVPIEIREKFNLAPASKEMVKWDFENLKDIARFSRENLSQTDAKVFIFDDFNFKVLSQTNTNMTFKEGALYYSSTSENSQRWYDEYILYKEQTGSGDLKKVIEFALKTGCTHFVMPRGEWSGQVTENLLEIYKNADYTMFEIQK